jgi:hypothetical protein
MKPAIANSKPVNKAPRCKHQFENGTRCRLHSSYSNLSFCHRHAHLPENVATAEDLSAELIDPIKDFLSPLEINDFLTRLVILLAKNKIATRRAAVMAYITNQLLRTLPAIEHEIYPTGENKIPQVIWDIGPKPQSDSSAPTPSDSESAAQTDQPRFYSQYPSNFQTVPCNSRSHE